MKTCKSVIAIFILVLLASQTFAQRNTLFDAFELQLGFKNTKADKGVFSYRMDSIMPDTASMWGSKAIGPTESIVFLGGGVEIDLGNRFFAAAKGAVYLKGAKGGEFALGLGYRFRLNYFLRLHPELLVSWTSFQDSIGKLSYTPDQMTLIDMRFMRDARLTTYYKNQQYGFQPKLSFIADVGDKFEFRFTLMYQLGIIYNQSLVVKGAITTGQDGKKVLPFRKEELITKFDGEDLTKSLYRSSGFSARVGFAIKLYR